MASPSRRPPQPADDLLPDRPFVIGTAGHVDHGKSSLVRALTGIDPDRLAEEKTRAMTIELGFAWLTLPGGQTVSIVDVPGHERFIKTMLAGVGGIDAALLVIAADEGPMPQTDEHLAILDLLGVERGVVVLTKIDIVDEEWLGLVEEEVRERLSATTLADAPRVAVSSLTGAGLPELREMLAQVLAAVPARTDIRAPRLPVDRIFSVAGFGTVVTGTLQGGEMATGDELQLYPHDRLVRVRGLQSHEASVSRALPGRRTAVNLSGITTDEIARGTVLAPRGLMKPTMRLDVRLRLIPESPIALKQNDAVDFFTGAAEMPARVTLLDRERLEPGETGWVQLRFASPLAVRKYDRFIVRRASPSETIGGGEIIDANPPRHKRFRPETLAALETLAAGSPEEIVLQRLAQAPLEVRELRTSTAGLSAGIVDEALARLLSTGDALAPGNQSGSLAPTDVVLSAALWLSLSQRTSEMLRSFHAANPRRVGLPREEARGRLGLTPRFFDVFIAHAASTGLVQDDGPTLRLPDFRVTLDSARRARADAFLAAIAANPFSPPGPHEHDVDGEILAVLEQLGEIVKAADGVYFTPSAWEALVAGTLAYIDDHGAMTLSGFRDHFGTSRKYAQAALEHLDRLKYTRRIGDDRVRGTRQPNEHPAHSTS